MPSGEAENIIFLRVAGVARSAETSGAYSRFLMPHFRATERKGSAVKMR
jgi:hypothetical protein